MTKLNSFRARLSALPLGIGWSGIGFALRTTAASLIALYIAFLMELDAPKWAAMTVWIVAQSSRGMSLSKSQYRAVGTVVGAGVGGLLVALFAQSPELFLTALALWIGLCTAVATGLRNFRAYAAALAGYTAAITAMGAISAPERVFDIAVARVTYVLLGIAIEAVLRALLAPGTPDAEVRQRLDAYVRQAAGICGQALRGEAADDAALHRVFAGAVALDTATEYAAAASGAVRRQFDHLRAATAAVLAQLAAAQTLREHLAQGIDGAAATLVAEAATILDALAADADGARPAVASMRERVEAAAAARGTPCRVLLLFERLEALLAAVHEALVEQQRLAMPNPPAARTDFAFHVDAVAAVQNGIRAAVAVLAASAFWILTAWPSGVGFVTIVGVVCALFASRGGNAVAGSLGWLKAGVYASVAAAACNFLLLPAVSGFAMFALASGVFMVGAGIALSNPRTAGPAAAFALFFWDLLGPQNSVRAEVASFLNGSLALALGIGCASLVFALVFPANPQAARTRLHRAMRRDLARLGNNPGAWSAEAWLSLTADRLGRQLATAASVPAEQAVADMRRTVAALTMGQAAIGLHRLVGELDAVRRPAAAVLRRLGKLDPDRLSRAARAALGRLARQAERAGAAEARKLRRGAVLMHEIAAAASAHAAFLRG